MRLMDIMLKLSELYLSIIKVAQIAKYKRLSKEFIRYYGDICINDISKYCMPGWLDYIKKIESFLIPSPSYKFLQTDIFKKTMFVSDKGGWIEKELELLEKKFKSKELRRILKEDSVGKPIISNFKYLTSHNSIHQLYHIIYFEKESKKHIKETNTIVEWGGGYGSMAKVIKRLKPTMKSFPNLSQLLLNS